LIKLIMPALSSVQFAPVDQSSYPDRIRTRQLQSTRRRQLA
jgi:hypothetical protein